MRIGEVAQATGVSTKALRFYERSGLLPDPDRTPSGYRDYRADTIDRVRFIKDAQAAGFTLAQVGEILAVRDDGQPPCEHVTDLVGERLVEVEARIAELEAVRAELRTLAARSQDFDPADCHGYCALIAGR